MNKADDLYYDINRFFEEGGTLGEFFEVLERYFRDRKLGD